MKQYGNTLSWLIVLVALLATPLRAAGSGLDGEQDILPYRYAWVGNKDVPVYADAGDPTESKPVRYLRAYNTWVSIKDEIKTDPYLWYRINAHEYVLASSVWVGSPSAFRGVTIDTDRRLPLGFVLADDLNVRSRSGIAADNPSLDRLPRYAVIQIVGHEAVDGQVWYRIGTNRYVHSEYVRVVTQVRRPDGVAANEKWIAVNLAEQTLTAYEGERMVFATLVSTGLPWWQTPEGLFRIQTKLRVADMTRRTTDGSYVYYLQDVPWTMYFEGPFGLHAAYWHDGFGYQRSRGCVNLSPSDARWLFEWTAPTLQTGRQVIVSTAEQPGTWVYVHNTPADLTPVWTPSGTQADLDGEWMAIVDEGHARSGGSGLYARLRRGMVSQEPVFEAEPSP